MALSLPSNPNLERFRRDARRLQGAVTSRLPEALALVAEHHPEGPPVAGAPFALADAQLVVARSYGFASWPRLREYLRRSERLRRDPVALDPLGDSATDPMTDPMTDPALLVASLACLLYSDRDEPARWARAASLLAQRPGLTALEVGVAAVSGDVEALGRHVRADPGAATRETGPFRWPPLLYVVYSRMPQSAAPACTRLLLDAGADADSGYLWQGLPTPFTALTGCFGGGEMGPGRQPRHPAWRELALLLLRGGADPNDRQTLYNRMFTRDDSHLELLLAHGLGHPSQEVWAGRTGVDAEPVDEMMNRQLHWAHDHGFDDRVALLGRHGFVLSPVASTRPAPGIHRAATAAAVRAAVADCAHVDATHHGRTALHQAALTGDLEVIAALLEAGADHTRVDREHGTTPLEWARWARNEAAADLLSDPPHYGGAHDDA
ncbi:MAG: ankyrin repeat domain-containing protein [Terracoccus sp.]